MEQSKKTSSSRQTRSSKQAAASKPPQGKPPTSQEPEHSPSDLTESDKTRLIHELSVRLSRSIADHDRVLERLSIRDIDDKDREIQDLSTELQNLKAEYEAVFQAYRSSYNMSKFFISFPAPFLRSNGSTWGPELEATCREANQIALLYGITSTNDMDAFSDDDKKNVIASLEGYLVQEDYSQIIPRLPKAACVNAPEVFLTMFIVKDMVSKFYTNPFWYVGPDPAEAMKNDRAKEDQERFAEHLYSISQRFEKANPELYEHWRVTTCRLANVYDVKSRGQDYEFGELTAHYREKLIRCMVSDILNTKTCQLLLKEPRKIQPGDHVYEELLKLYNRAAQNAIHMSFWEVEPEIYLLDRLSPTFHHRSDRAQVAVQHFLSKTNPLLDGKPVLGLTAPALHVRAVPRGYPALDKVIGIDDWKLKAHVLVDVTERLDAEQVE
ncbi:uncharacterized protein BDV14DRAFT_167728 [Aspergillus stella-maris]|uniref:uncharacterized protein n=1 Tax=Aspergillus stella-maris TaxID=1810926 RepID=UPI003CCD8285